MAAPSGNTNATKWTLEATLETLKKVMFHAEDDYVYTLGRALTRSDTHQGVWTYWKKKWADNEEVMEQMYIIDQLFVDKLMEGAITKRLHMGMCLFALRVNHGVSDKPAQEAESKPAEKMPVQLAEELKQIEEAKKTPAPLPAWAAALPHMYTNVRPTDGSIYREVAPDIYTTYTEAECDEADNKVYKHQKEHGKWINWVLPEEEYVRGRMRAAA